MSDNEKMQFLNKINDVYNYDNGYKSCLIGDEAEKPILHNYVTFEHRLEAYKIEDKIIKIIENISIKEEEKNDENIATIEMKLRGKELIKKKINVKDKCIIKELKDIYEKYLNIRNKAEENFSFYYWVAQKIGFKYYYNEWVKGIGNIYNKTTTEIIALLNNNYLNYEKEMINLINLIESY